MSISSFFWIIIGEYSSYYSNLRKNISMMQQMIAVQSNIDRYNFIRISYFNRNTCNIKSHFTFVIFVFSSTQYLWRIPVNEVDRPGSFCTHIYRAVYLLLDVLLEAKDNQLLLHVSAFLYKTPDKDRYVVTSYRCVISTAGGKRQIYFHSAISC